MRRKWRNIASFSAALEAAWMSSRRASTSPRGRPLNLSICDGVIHPCLRESFQAQPAAIAAPASAALFVRIVAAQSRRIIDAKPHAFADDLRLCEPQERRVDTEDAAAFNG